MKQLTWRHLLMILGAVIATGLAVDLRHLYQAHQLDTWLEQPDRIPDRAPSIAQLAKAKYLADSGAAADAMRLYQDLTHAPADAERRTALYNLGTLYLRAAESIWSSQGAAGYVKLNPLLDEAKRHFRALLREDPMHWDARYNLEYAYRITPPPRELEKSDWQGSKSSVFATIPGIPGGGP